jgi:transposase
MTVTPVGTRWAIVYASQQGRSCKAVAAEVGVSQKTCRQWITMHQLTGTVDEQPRGGRRCILSKAGRAAALALLLSNKVGGAKAVAQELRSKGMTATTVSKQTIIRAARLAAKQKGMKPLKTLRGKPQKQLTADTLRKRLDFCLKHQKSSWSSVMFTDRKKFAFKYPGSKVYPVTWVEGSGERRANTVNHASVVNVYAGITKFGLTKLHVVAGTTGHKTIFATKQGAMAKNITASEYRAVLERTLLPEGRRLFGAQGVSSWVLQQDNDPTHKAAPQFVKEYNQKHGCSITVLPNWPPNSPDLSLIENVWSFLQFKLDSLGCQTFQAFKAALEKEAKSIDRVFSERLFAGMQARVVECLKKKGDLTKH